MRSKRRSATKPKPAPPSSATYFTDRDLGKSVPRKLREAGFRVESYFEHFSREDVADNQWLGFVAARGRLFILRGKGDHAALAETFLAASAGIERLLAAESSFIAKIRRVHRTLDGVHAEVVLRLTLEDRLLQASPGSSR